MYDAILNGKGWEKLRRAIRIEEKLSFSGYKGKEKGQIVKRVFWAVADVHNISEIEKTVENILQTNRESAHKIEETNT